MGPSRKSGAVRRNRPRLVVEGEFVDGGVPECPLVLVFESSRVWWESFWGSPVGLLVDRVSDFSVVVRLVSLLELREGALVSVLGEPLVLGSQGQPVENPLAKALSRYDSEIRQLEDRLGLSPRARLALGVTLGAAKRSLEDLVSGGQVEDDVEGEDFRGVIDV